MSTQRKGITVEADQQGAGAEVRTGDMVTIRYSLALNRGDVIDSQKVASFALGKREMIAGLEYGVEGMRVGGRRRFRASPHLCYRETGVPGKIPPNAVLIFDVEVTDVRSPSCPLAH